MDISSIAQYLSPAQTETFFLILQNPAGQVVNVEFDFDDSSVHMTIESNDFFGHVSTNVNRQGVCFNTHLTPHTTGIPVQCTGLYVTTAYQQIVWD